MPLEEHLNELNFVLMELCGIDVQMEYKDLAMILLAFLPPSYENFVGSLSVGKDSIIIEEVKSNIYSRELQLKVSWNDEEPFKFELLVIDSAKEQKKKKGKGGKRNKVDPKDICNYYKELGHWK